MIQRWQGNEIPDIDFSWYDPDGQLYDFSSGWTFTVRVGNPGQPAVVTPTGTGAATAPNLTVTFTPGQLDSVTPGTYHLETTPHHVGTNKDLKTRVDMFQVLQSVAVASP